MDNVPAPNARPNIPRITIADEVTIWIVSVDGSLTNYHPWRGDRTVIAVAAALLREKRAGRLAHLELETSSCGPTELSLQEVASLGVLS